MPEMGDNLLKIFTVLACLAVPFAPGQQNTDSHPPFKEMTPKAGSAQVQSYDAIRATLPERTSVPLRLPIFIPPYADEKNAIFAILESVSSRGYKIQLAWAKDCMGGNWCHLGEISGSADPLPREGRRIPVALGLGIQGYFVDFTCGAHCDDSAIYWNERGYYYSVAMKAERKETLVKMVHSAIASVRK
jgi:hypothetical protein